MKDKGVVIVKFLSMKLILLSSLVCHIMPIATREDDLIRVMDVASNLQRYKVTLESEIFQAS